MIIASHIGVHPKALLEYDRQDAKTRQAIDARVAGYADPVSFYVDRLAEGIATLTASVAPNPVIVRMSDFKSNEYANLIGGQKYEPEEENPMIGFRGASRYVDPSFAEAFALECRAVLKVRNEMGLDNLWVMIPFVRTLDEGRKVIKGVMINNNAWLFFEVLIDKNPDYDDIIPRGLEMLVGGRQFFYDQINK